MRVRADYLGRYRSVSGQSKCLLLLLLELEKQKAKQRGFMMTRNQIEQALIDLLGRALAGLDQAEDASLRMKYAI